jgi:orotate phosphoribosyltransferase-like protein
MTMSLQKLLTEIYDTGMTDAQIGAEIDVSQPTAWRLRNGKHEQTTLTRIEAIKALHAKRCRKRNRKRASAS